MNDNSTPTSVEGTTPSPASTVSADAPSSEAGTPASASAGTETHPHHSLVHGATVIIDSLINQLENAVAEDCKDAISMLHNAAANLRVKIETIYKKL